MKKIRLSWLMTPVMAVVLFGSCESETTVTEDFISGARKQQEKCVQYVSGVASTVYSHSGMKEVLVRTDIPYSDDNLMDIYYPKDADRAVPLPAMVFLNGMSGLDAKDFGQIIDWSLLTAAEGVIAVSFNSTYADGDTEKAIGYLVDNSRELGIDPERIGVFSTCGACYLGVHAVQNRNLKLGVFLYGLMPEYGDLSTDTTIVQVITGKGLEPHYASSIQQFHRDAEDAGARSILLNYENGSKYFDHTENPKPEWNYTIDARFAADVDMTREILNVMKQELSA